MTNMRIYVSVMNPADGFIIRSPKIAYHGGRKEVEHMPIPRDLTMLQANSHNFLLAMAKCELEPIELAEKANVSRNIVYAMRKGCFVKPKYFGAIARALNVTVEELVSGKEQKSATEKEIEETDTELE